jgi:hypothetical protein
LRPLASRPTVYASAWWGVCVFAHILTALLLFLVLTGCSSSANRYLLVDKSLLASDYRSADAIIQKAEDEYGPKSRVLYGMDRGMMLQLAGDYQQSNEVLEQAEDEIDRLYTEASVRNRWLS